MKKVCLLALAFAGLFVSSAASEATITEDFSANPLEGGWQVFGNTNLFRWDATSRWLDVTWDSAQPNSFFYHPIEGYLTRYDDFAFEFDLKLNDIASGVEPGKTGPLQLGIGFLNLAGATSTNFMRSGYGSAPNVAEFNYFPWGYYEGWGDALAATVPAFISGSGYDYAPPLVAPYNNELPTNQTIHVAMSFMASNQTVLLSLTTNGAPLAQMPPLLLVASNNFGGSVNFHVDAFSISSYSSAGDYYNSLLAHGAVSNVRVTLPPPASGLALARANDTWQVSFANRTNWVYALERATDFETWGPASAPVEGNGGSLTLTDTNTPAGRAFYRVKANRP